MHGAPQAIDVAPLFAREPIERYTGSRDAVRMLVSDRRTGIVSHRGFTDLPGVLEPGDLLIVNDSATLPAALAADDGSAVVHFSAQVAGDLWIVEPRDPQANGRRPLDDDVRAALRGARITFGGDVAVAFLAPVHSDSTRLWYATIETPRGVLALLAERGRPIRYAYVDDDFGIEAYQTIFARVAGSAEMPSAARPFTAATLEALRARDVTIATITLHAGVSSPEAHEPPAAEWFAVPHATVASIEAARKRGASVIAVGTTVVRALESASLEGSLTARSGWTQHLVNSDHPPRIADGLLTGLHEPQASHLAMLSGFLRKQALSEAYRAAADSHYLWHEFGDVHLIV